MAVTVLKGPNPCKEPQVANPQRTMHAPADSKGQKRIPAQTRNGTQRKSGVSTLSVKTPAGPKLITQTTLSPSRRMLTSINSLRCNGWCVPFNSRIRNGVSTSTPRAWPAHQAAKMVSILAWPNPAGPNTVEPTTALTRVADAPASSENRNTFAGLEKAFTPP